MKKTNAPDPFNLSKSDLDKFRAVVGAIIGKPAAEVDCVDFMTECEHAAWAWWCERGLLYGLTPEQLRDAMRSYRGTPAPAPVAKPRPKPAPVPAPVPVAVEPDDDDIDIDGL